MARDITSRRRYEALGPKSQNAYSRVLDAVDLMVEHPDWSRTRALRAAHVDPRTADRYASRVFDREGRRVRLRSNDRLYRSEVMPAWLDRPAMHAVVLAHPSDFCRVRRLNRGMQYQDGFKPFNMLLMAHRDRFMARADDPGQLITAWAPDPAEWAELRCLDPIARDSYAIRTRGRTGTFRDWQRMRGAMLVESMRAYLEQHFTRPEPASTRRDGGPSGSESSGVLLAQAIAIEGQIVTGKETNRLNEVRTGWSSTDEERQPFAGGYSTRQRSRLTAVAERACAWPGCEARLAGRQRRWCGKHARRSGGDRLAVLGIGG